MDEDDEYDSDSTVLLTDFEENPEKINVKRRRLDANYNKHRRRSSHATSDENNELHDSLSRTNGEVDTTTASGNYNEVDKQKLISDFFTKMELAENTDNLQGNHSGQVKEEIVEIESDDDEVVMIVNNVITIADSDDDCIEIIPNSDTSTVDRKMSLSREVGGAKLIRRNGRRATVHAFESSTALNINDFTSPVSENITDARIKVLKPAVINSRRVTIDILESTEVTVGNIVKSPNINLKNSVTDGLNKNVTEKKHVDFNLKASSENNTGFRSNENSENIVQMNLTKAIENDRPSRTNENNAFQEITASNLDNIPTEVNNTAVTINERPSEITSNPNVNATSTNSVTHHNDGNVQNTATSSTVAAVEHPSNSTSVLDMPLISDDLVTNPTPQCEVTSVFVANSNQIANRFETETDNVTAEETHRRGLLPLNTSLSNNEADKVEVKTNSLKDRRTAERSNQETSDLNSSKSVYNDVIQSSVDKDNDNSLKAKSRTSLEISSKRIIFKQKSPSGIKNDDCVKHKSDGKTQSKKRNSSDSLPTNTKRSRTNSNEQNESVKVVENRAEDLPLDETDEREAVSYRDGKQLPITNDELNKRDKANKKTGNNCQKELDLSTNSKRRKTNSDEQNENVEDAENRAQGLIGFDSHLDETIEREEVSSCADKQMPITNNELNKREKGYKKNTGLKVVESQAEHFTGLSLPSDETLDRESASNRADKEIPITVDEFNKREKANKKKPSGFQVVENRTENLTGLDSPSDETLAREGAGTRADKEVPITIDGLNKREKANKEMPTDSERSKTDSNEQTGNVKVAESRAENLTGLRSPLDKTLEWESARDRAGKQVPITNDEINKHETAMKNKPTKTNSEEQNENIIESREGDLMRLVSPPDETSEKEGVSNCTGKQATLTNNKLNKREKGGKKRPTGLKDDENRSKKLTVLCSPLDETLDREGASNRASKQVPITKEDLNKREKANKKNPTGNTCQKENDSGSANIHAESINRTESTNNNRDLNRRENVTDEAINHGMLPENGTTVEASKVTKKRYKEKNKCTKSQKKGNQESNKKDTVTNTDVAHPDCRESVDNVQPRDRVEDRENDRATSDGAMNASHASVMNSLKNCFSMLKESINKTESVSKTSESVKPNKESEPKIEAKKMYPIKAEKEYTCPVCSCVFSYRDSFLSHLKKNHDLENTKIPSSCIEIKCAICGVTYKRENYNSHVKTRHPDTFFKKVERDHNASDPLNLINKEDIAKIRDLFAKLKANKRVRKRSQQNSEEKNIADKQSLNSDSANNETRANQKETITVSSKDKTLNKARVHPDNGKDNKCKNSEQNLQKKNREEATHSHGRSQYYQGTTDQNANNNSSTDEEMEVNSNAHGHKNSRVTSNDIEKFFDPLIKKIQRQSGDKDNEGSCRKNSYTEDETSTDRQNEQKTNVAVKSPSYKFECKLCKEVVYSDYMTRKHREKHPHIKKKRKLFNKIVLSHENERCEVEQDDRVSENEESYDGSSDEVADASFAGSGNENNAGDQSHNRSTKTDRPDNHLNNSKYRYECNLCKKVMNSYYMTRKHRSDNHPEMINMPLFNKIPCDENEQSEEINENEASNDESDDEAVSGDDKSDAEDERNVGNAKKKTTSNEESTVRNGNNANANNHIRVSRRHKYKYECLECKKVFFSDYMSRKHRKNSHPQWKFHMPLFNRILMSKRNEGGDSNENEETSDSESHNEVASDVAPSSDGEGDVDDQSNASDSEKNTLNTKGTSDVNVKNTDTNNDVSSNKKTAKVSRSLEKHGDSNESKANNNESYKVVNTSAVIGDEQTGAGIQGKRSTENKTNPKESNVDNKVNKNDIMVKQRANNHGQRKSSVGVSNDEIDNSCNKIRCKKIPDKLENKKEYGKGGANETESNSDDTEKTKNKSCNKDDVVDKINKDNVEVNTAYGTTNVQNNDCNTNNKMLLAEDKYIFTCQECTLSSIVYDDVIRHCQNHYNEKEEPYEKCQTCHLNIAKDYFEEHLEIHDTNVKIINYSFKKLFRNWNEIFDGIPEDISQMIQARTIYKTHCIKMGIAEEGSWEHTLYQCNQCEVCVPSNEIEKHFEKTCYDFSCPCLKCGRCFATYAMLCDHEKIHAIGAKHFRVVAFNSAKDRGYNIKLFQAKIQANSEAEVKTTDLYKCQCSLHFITEENYKIHSVKCVSSIKNGTLCHKCAVPLLFDSKELEKHLTLHHGTVKYDFRVQDLSNKKATESPNTPGCDADDTPPQNSDAGESSQQCPISQEIEADLEVKKDLLKQDSEETIVIYVGANFVI